ncbi:hypothetical protein GGG16DRAFT_116442 [Schizophyllum commune]
MVNKHTNKQRAVIGDPSRRDRHPGSRPAMQSSGNRAGPSHANSASVHPTLPSHIPDLQCNCIADMIRTIEDTSNLAHRPTYNIDHSDIAYTDLAPETIASRPIHAPRLKHLTLRGNNSEPKRQKQHTAVYGSLRARDLEGLSVLRPGRSTTPYDKQLFRFLHSGVDSAKFKHLTLNMRFVYRVGLENYLKSASAASLETLRLKTNVDIQSCLSEALVAGGRLAGLRTLIVRIKDLVPSELLDAMVARHRSLGDRDVLHTVEIAAPLSQATIERARRIGITLRKVAW